MKKRILIISVIVLAAILVGVALWFINGLFGNPVSALLARVSSEKHLDENYADSKYFIEDVSFSFKDGCYYAHVTDPDSPDSAFAIVMRMNGKVIYDTYEDSVVRRGNTARRLGDEYRERVDAVLEATDLPYDAHIAFGDILFTSRADMEEYGTPEYAVITDDLTLDGDYDVSEMGAESGELTVYIYDDTVSVERLSEILLVIRERMDKAGVGFYRIDCVLEYPRSEDGVQKEGRVEVMGFAYADIYGEELAERVAASDKAARDYYAEQDAEKFKESEA